MSNHYFNNDEVQVWMAEYIKLYKPYEECIKRAKLSARKEGKIFNEAEFFENEVPDETSFRMNLLKEKIFKEVIKIINGIIFTHKFTIWETYDDLFQEASEACIKALPKFDANFITSKGVKATAFNYFSLTAKRCLKFYTIRNKDHRNHQQIEDHEHLLKYDNEFTEDIISENLIKEMKNILKKNHKKFLPLLDILSEYLIKFQTYNKRDFFRYAKSYGWSPNLIRRFLKIIKEEKEHFYSEFEFKKDTHFIKNE